MATDNPRAFPRTGEGVGNPLYDEPGMTLRDWFAGQVVIGVAAYAGGPVPPELLAKAAFGLADAMLEARKGAP